MGDIDLGIFIEFIVGMGYIGPVKVRLPKSGLFTHSPVIGMGLKARPGSKYIANNHIFRSCLYMCIFL